MGRTIFVHGIFGWGEADPLWKVLPCWGMASGDLMAYLRKEGFDVAAASVGPISGAWDRACELYAQLTGTRTDYGAAHAERYGHERFGRTYEHAMAPDWSESHPLDFVGHSFGGTTIRLLAHLLSEGAPEEKEASPEDVSPLFTGGKGGWVKHVLCMSTPHNGSTLFEAWPFYTNLIEWIGVTASKTMGIADLSGIYDFKLEQFGFQKGDNESLREAIKRVSGLKLPENDWARDDLKVDHAAELNEKIRMVPGVTYISVPGRRTRTAKNGEERPVLAMTAPLQPVALAMGRFIDQKTEGGVVIGPQWAANDGLVNTYSARCPFGEASVRCTINGIPRPGVWNVLPAVKLDHLEIQGGANPFLRDKLRVLYKGLLELMARERT